MSGASSSWPANRLYTDIDFSKPFCLTHVATHKKADLPAVSTARTFQRGMAWAKVDKTQLNQSGDTTFKVFEADANGKPTNTFKGTMQLQEGGARLAFHRMAKSEPAGLADTAEQRLYFKKVNSLSIALEAGHSWYEATDHKV